MTAHALGAGLALAAATAFACASALQHRENAQVAPRSALDPGLLAALVRRPWWLAGLAADGAAVALQALALRHGPVALVQPVLALGLPLAVLLSCAGERRRLQRSERDGALLCTAGLCLLATVLSGATAGRSPGRGTGAVAAGVLTAVVLALLAQARRHPGLAPVATGAAAGVVLGSGGVLLALCAVGADAPLALLHTPTPYLAVLVGLLGLLLSQAAFQTGTLGLPLAALAIAEPVAAVLLGVTVLREGVLLSQAALLTVCVGAVLAVAGILVLSRQDGGVSPCALGQPPRTTPAARR